MKSNYNDIIDIILTLIDDEEIASSIAVSGSIVTYIISNKESFEYHTDFYILVKEKKIKMVRDKIKKLSKEYQLDIVSDSKRYSKEDYGIKIKYENTTVGFFPYSLIDNNFSVKTYGLNKYNMEVRLKTKIVPNVTKSSIIRLTKFTNDKTLRIMSPEFILADKEAREKEPGNPTKETMRLLNNLSDESVLKVIRESVGNTRIKVQTRKLKENNTILIIILLSLIILLITIAYICFKK